MQKQIQLSKIVLPVYKDFWNFRGRYLVVKGSRASGKSYVASQKIIYNLLKFPESHALVVRNEYNRLKDSCFNQLKIAIEQFGLSDDFEFTTSPLQIRRKSTGQIIYFSGFDQADKIKSIVPPFGYLCFVWLEEAYSVKKESNFNILDNSIRGYRPEGYYIQFIVTFNPTSSKTWLKRKFFDVPDSERKLSMTTNYLTNPYLSDEDLKVFEDMRKFEPKRYLVDGKGEWGIAEGLIYNNYCVEEFEESKLNLPLCIGLDWGFSADATAIVVFRVDEIKKLIYIIDECYAHQMLNEHVANWLKSNGYTNANVICDSSEPKSIETIKRLGIKRAKGAKKGKGSILQGIRQLQSYKMIISPECENIVTELQQYRWRTDKQSDLMKDEPIDDWNHCLDALRYGMQALECGKMRTSTVRL